jgi:hypothetical protein
MMGWRRQEEHTWRRWRLGSQGLICNSLCWQMFNTGIFLCISRCRSSNMN